MCVSLSSIFMAVSVMQIRIVRMLVTQGLMAMMMRMGLIAWPVMSMLVMIVVGVSVIVFKRLMNVPMVMAFRKVQPKPKAHQQPGREKL
ncbi:hypothetical protein ASE37_00300 [Rhizobium sp. Root268]|nr:hypothetical protein ASC86_00300 [Rhizobium sp. Root1212]KRD37491.1 hypothetical protein ASE37_00300 [Rhizobium sp. Root268]